MTIDAIEHITRHVVETGFDDLPQEAIAASQKFILDLSLIHISEPTRPY